MTYDRFLEIAGNWAAIVTAAVAAVAYGSYRWDRYKKRRRLEEHLRQEKERGHDQGQRSILHLMAELRMTESGVLDAAFRSKKVRCVTKVDEQFQAKALMFEYVDEALDLELLRRLR